MGVTIDGKIIKDEILPRKWCKTCDKETLHKGLLCVEHGRPFRFSTEI